MKTKNLLVLALFPMLLAGCNNQAPAYSASIIDAQGRQVSYNSNRVSRVICIGAGALRYYSYIGNMNNIIAVEEIDSGTTFGVGQALRPYYTVNYNKLKNLPLIGKGGPMAQVADKEKLAAANPDIIVSFLSAEANNDLQDTIHVPVIGLKQGGDGIFADETINSLKILGQVFNRSERATEIENYINTCKADFANLTVTTEKYYFGGIGNWGQTSMYGTMLGFPVAKYAKVTPAVTETTDKDGNPVTRGQVSIDMEKLQSANPDKIFMDTAGLNNFVADYKAEGNKAKYDALKAFEDKETYLLMPYNAYYSNLEIQLMSTYYVASVAHPTEFASFNMANKSNEILNKLLGSECYSDLQAHTYGQGAYAKFDIGDLVK